MTYYFNKTKPDRFLPLYADRFSFAAYLAKNSSKLKYLVKFMGEIALSEERCRHVLIFVEGPMSL